MYEREVPAVLVPGLQKRVRLCVVLGAGRKEEALHDTRDHFLRQAVLGSFEYVALLRDRLAVGSHG